MHLRCQNPDCVSVLEVGSVPVIYDSMLKQMFVDSDDTIVSAQSEKLEWETLRDCARRGDQVGFAAQVAEICTGPSGTLLPLCDPCLDSAVKQRTRALADAVSQRDSCLNMLHAIRSVTPPADSPGSGPGHDLQGLLAALEAEEAREHERIRQATARTQALAVRAARLQVLERRASGLEASLWRDTSSLRRTLVSSRDRMSSLVMREDRLRWALARTRTLSVLSDAFFIWHRGPYVTINSARLGRLPGQPVEWPEINAALGQMALAMAVTAQRVGFLFTRYRIVPMGSYARLTPVGEDAYSSSRGLDVFWSPGALLDGNLGLPFFGTNKLTNSLKALMACLGEFVAWAEARDHSFRVPHPISSSGDKVGDVPTAMGRDVAWSRAMKLAATDLKWLIAWAHKQPLPG